MPKTSNIYFEQTFGNLSIYSLDSNSLNQKIFTTDSFISSNAPYNLLDLSYTSSPQSTVILEDEVAKAFTPQATLSHSQAFFNLYTIYPKKTEDPRFFPHVSTPPGSKKYLAVRLKEHLLSLGFSQKSTQAQQKLILFGKRLLEIKLALAQNDTPSAKKILSEYNGMISPLFNLWSSVPKSPPEQIWHEQELFEAVSGHLAELTDLESSPLNSTGSVTSIKSQLRSIAVDAKVIPAFDPVVTPDFQVSNRLVYQFSVTAPATYELLIPQTLIFPDALDLPTNFQYVLDDKLLTGIPTKTSLGLRLGLAYLTPGLHELSLNQIPGPNLLASFSPTTLDTATSAFSKEIPFAKFDPFVDYDIALEYKNIYGSGLNVQLQENTTSPSFYSTDLTFPIDKYLGFDGYWFDTKNFVSGFSPNPNSDSALIRLQVKIWNNCLESFINLKWKCSDPLLKSKFNRPTKTEIYSVSATPKFPRSALLLATSPVPPPSPNQVKSFTCPDPTRCQVELLSAPTKPFLLVFSELFDSGWQAHINGQPIAETKHLLANGFANSWVLEPGSNSTIDLIFTPQNRLSTGYQLTGLVLVVETLLLLIIFTKTFKKTK